MSEEPGGLVRWQRERWAWATLITLLGLFNLWHWTTGHGEQRMGMLGAIAVLTLGVLGIARFAYLVRRNRRATDRDRP